jgi:uncharacterized protein YjiS (DUF1127 family)
LVAPAILLFSGNESTVWCSIHSQVIVAFIISLKELQTITEMTMSMFPSIVRLYQAWRRHEAVRRELSQLTDRELADIGINRSDIDRIASGEA